MLLWLVALSVVCVVEGSGSKLPSWITPCYRDDPKFDECAVTSGQASIPRLVKGDRKARIPVMEPLEIVEIQLDSSVTHLGLDLTLRNVSVRGLGNTKLAAFHMNFKEQYLELSLLVPRMEIICSYNISGRVLVLPITGAGPGNFTLQNVLAIFFLRYNLEKNPKDGKDYMMVNDFNLNFNTSRLYIKLDNLFNGDKLLGSTMNQFMNDNWQELVGNIGPVVSSALGGVLIQIFNVVAKIISFDEFAPLKPPQN